MRNLQEMSLEEMRQTEGGFAWGLFLAVVLVVALITYVTKEN